MPGISYRKGLTLFDIIDMFPMKIRQSSGCLNNAGRMVLSARTAILITYSLTSNTRR